MPHKADDLNALKSALRYLDDLKKLRENSLAHLPLIKGKQICHARQCDHHDIGECVRMTIARIVEERIRDYTRRGETWEGTVLLWLYYIYPTLNGKFKISVRHDFPYAQAGIRQSLTEEEQTLTAGLVQLQTELLNGQQLQDLFSEWFIKPSTRYKRINSIYLWLLKQLTNHPEQIFLKAARNLEALYKRFTVVKPGTFETEEFSFEDGAVIPGLQFGTKETQLTEMLEDPDKVYICGPVGSGKTTMCGFMVWYLARNYANRVTALRKEVEKVVPIFPLPIDCRHLGLFEACKGSHLPALAVAQWRIDLRDMNMGENILTPDDLYSLPDLLLSKGLLPTNGLLPIVDNWDSFDYEYSLRIWHLPFENLLGQYPGYIIFARNPIPSLISDWTRVSIYQMMRLTGSDQLQIRNFIHHWTQRRKTFAWEAMWAELQKNTNEAVQQMAKTPLELAQLCFYFERNGSLPESTVQLIQQITELIISTETRLLSRGTGDKAKIQEILGEIALNCYVTALLEPRGKIGEAVRVEQARNLFQGEDEENKIKKNLFDALCNSQFFAFRFSELGQEIVFTSDLYRDYYAATRLVALKDRGRSLVMQGINHDTWGQLLNFYAQLGAEAKNE